MYALSNRAAYLLPGLQTGNCVLLNLPFWGICRLDERQAPGTDGEDQGLQEEVYPTLRSAGIQ